MFFSLNRNVIRKKVGPMIFVGVDGCKKGWFAVKLTDDLGSRFGVDLGDLGSGLLYCDLVSSIKKLALLG